MDGGSRRNSSPERKEEQAGNEDQMIFSIIYNTILVYFHDEV